MVNKNETVEQVCEMSLDFAINHAQEAGDRLIKQDGCEACGREHHQLATWLRELKDCRSKLAAKDEEIAKRDALIKDMTVALSAALDIVGNVSEFLSLDCGTMLRVETHREMLAKAREVLGVSAKARNKEVK